MIALIQFFLMMILNMLIQTFKRNVFKYLIKYFNALKIILKVFKIMKMKVKSLM